MEQTFAFDHAALLAAFQAAGDPRFLWGLDRSTGGLFYLEENQGDVQRENVVANVICPVPGCVAQLTSVHSTVKRDHLRHRSSSGGHGPESLFHSQGCALIESWLSRTYPLCQVQREEYTSVEGESRADVLITSPDGRTRVAFEVQYSPLTHDAWSDRHERYRRRGVQDVWLFGHTRKQLKLDADERLKSNPALAAAVAAGAPLLFINPETEQIAIAVDQHHPISVQTGAPLTEHDVPVLGSASGSTLEVHPLRDFWLGTPALTSDRIDFLIRGAASLADYNAEQQRIHTLLRAKAEERERMRKAAEMARAERVKRQRVDAADAIRRALTGSEPWGIDHPVLPLLHAYLDGRRDRNLGWEAGVPERWKCLAYFHHVASNEAELFGPPQVSATLRRHGVRLEKGIYKTIALWLRQLVDDEFLFEERGADGFATYRPNFRGTWW